MPRRRSVLGLPLSRVVVAAALLGLVAFSGSLLFLILRQPEPTFAFPAPPEDAPTVSGRLVVPVTLDTLHLPDESERLTRRHWLRFRPPRERWTAEDVERFWIDPGMIGAEYLSETNRRLIEEMLKDVP
ncbi:MAG: hypothetical protein EA403_15935 [Spirochaetaceae bacterium]|nr:MAG: hypothetical protein EA403_15935 [Spirochaetaceae bacterium]